MITLAERLARAAARHPTHGITVVDRNQRADYPELAERARHCAHALRAALPHASHGAQIALLLPTCVEFYVALLGVQLAGFVPSPFAPPSSIRGLAEAVRGYDRALRAGGCRVLIIDDALRARLGPAIADLDVTILSIDQLLRAPAIANELPAIDPQRDLALVQYTSGSTSRPKGVALTHAQLGAGIDAIVAGIALDHRDVNGQWLPIHHDMGLIGSLAGMDRGVDQFLWSPLTFVRDPIRWLRQFAARRATIYAGPSFSYAELLRGTPEELEELDLTAWRVALNGAEPVDVRTLRAFGERFAPHGLRPEAVMPVYGLAEITLAATFPALGSRWHARTIDPLAGAGDSVDFVPGGREVAAVGAPVAGHAIRICHRGEPLPDGRIGEIQLRGPAVMRDYYRDPVATAEAFDAGWLRTGDLGFTLGGELFVTGRAKELMILNGRNYYPHDIEDVVQRLPGCHRGMAVAFAATDERGEHMVVVAETRCDPAAAHELAIASQRAVSAAFAIPRLEVVLVRPGAVPRTTSGKRQRLLVRSRLREPAFQQSVIWSSAGAS
jgi:acyl-CoA synthetase (AMP-forming)/AMP-acid ligase II